MTGPANEKLSKAIAETISDMMAMNIEEMITPYTTASQEKEVMTMDDLKEAIEMVGTDPVIEFMKSKGFDPKDGCRMILPEVYRRECGEHRYVDYSLAAHVPLFYRPDFTYFQRKCTCEPLPGKHDLTYFPKKCTFVPPTA
jgi:hypothetical protein